MTMTPRLILVCGLPGAGKTTLARRLAGRHSAVRLSEDEWLAELGIDLHDETARRRLETAFWRLAQDLLGLGQSVVLESGFWSRIERDEKRSGGQGLGALVELHLLDVPFDVRWERVRRRNGRRGRGAVITREQLAGMDLFFERPDAEEMRLFDVARRHQAPRAPAQPMS